eukprot:5345887-Prymnesium_polylepis.1
MQDRRAKRGQLRRVRTDARVREPRAALWPGDTLEVVARLLVAPHHALVELRVVRARRAHIYRLEARLALGGLPEVCCRTEGCNPRSLRPERWAHVGEEVRVARAHEGVFVPKALQREVAINLHAGHLPAHCLLMALYHVQPSRHVAPQDVLAHRSWRRDRQLIVQAAVIV